MADEHVQEQSVGGLAPDERAEILYEVREHRRRIDGLEKAVFLGNGHRPLMERTTSLESDVSSIRSSMDEIRDGVNNLRDELKDDIKAVSKGQNVIVLKVLGGVAALLAVFVAATLAFVLHS